MLSSGHMSQSQLRDLDPILQQAETEHNWAAKESGIKTLANACAANADVNLDFIQFIKNHRKGFAESLMTERTRLSGTACEFVEKLAKAMGRNFDAHFGDFFTASLLKVCGRTNKVMVSRAVNAMNSIIDAGSLTCLPKACAQMTNQSKPLKIACIGIIVRCITKASAHELEPYLDYFEPVLKAAVSDAHLEVRNASREGFKTYASKFPDRSTSLADKLDRTAYKYLYPEQSAGRAKTPTLGLRAASATGFRRPMSPAPPREPVASSGYGKAPPDRQVLRAQSMPVQDFKAAHHGSLASVATSVMSTSTSTVARPGRVNSTGSNSPGYRAQSVERASHGQTAAPTRNSYMADVAEGPGSGPAPRSTATRNRIHSSTTLTTSSMLARSPAINLVTNGGPQRLVPASGTSTSAVSKSVRPSVLMSRPSKTDPISKPIRSSTISGTSGSSLTLDRDRMSASERAKAYSAGLKNEMANKRSNESSRVTLSGRRATSDSASSSSSSAASSFYYTHHQQQPQQRSSNHQSYQSLSQQQQQLSRYAQHQQQPDLYDHQPLSPRSLRGPRSASPQLESYSRAYPISKLDYVSLGLDPDHLPNQHHHQQQHHQQQQQQQHRFYHQQPPSHHEIYDGYYDYRSPEYDDSQSSTGVGGGLPSSLPSSPDRYSDSFPEHESLFGNTETYIMADQEIANLRQEEEMMHFTDEVNMGLELAERDQMAIQAYAEDYVSYFASTGATSPLSPSSIPSPTGKTASTPDSSCGNSVVGGNSGMDVNQEMLLDQQRSLDPEANLVGKEGVAVASASEEQGNVDMEQDICRPMSMSMEKDLIQSESVTKGAEVLASS